jgi:hypothetical protein
VSAIERQYSKIACVVVVATAVSSAFLAYVDASSWHAPTLRWMRDFGWFWGAALLLVFGIRALRRSGRTRDALASTALGALMFVLFAGFGLFADHVFRGVTETLRASESLDAIAPRPVSEEDREARKRAIGQIESYRSTLPQISISWFISGIGCAALGLLTPIRSRDEAEAEST